MRIYKLLSKILKVLYYCIYSHTSSAVQLFKEYGVWWLSKNILRNLNTMFDCIKPIAYIVEPNAIAGFTRCQFAVSEV